MRPIILRGHTRPITCLKYNREGDLIFVASKDSFATVWYTKNGELLGSFKHGGAVNWLDVNADTTRLLTAVANSKVCLWDVKTGKLIVEFQLFAPAKYVQFAEGGKQFLVVTEKLKKPPGIYIFDIPEECLKTGSYTSKKPLKPKLSIEVSKRINCAVWGPVNEMIIAGCDDGSLSVFSTKDGSEIAKSKEHKGSIKSISMSKDKMLFITASSDNTAKLFETKTLDVIKSYRSGEPVNAAAISPLKYHVILGGGTQAIDVTQTAARTAYFEVRFFNMVFEEEFATVKGHFGPVHTLSFTPDGKGYASGGEDGIVRMHQFDQEYFNIKDEPTSK